MFVCFYASATILFVLAIGLLLLVNVLRTRVKKGGVEVDMSQLPKKQDVRGAGKP